MTNNVLELFIGYNTKDNYESKPGKVTKEASIPQAPASFSIGLLLL